MKTTLLAVCFGLFALLSHAQTPSQFSSLKSCIINNPGASETYTGDCSVYSSPQYDITAISCSANVVAVTMANNSDTHVSFPSGKKILIIGVTNTAFNSAFPFGSPFTVLASPSPTATTFSYGVGSCPGGGASSGGAVQPAVYDGTASTIYIDPIFGTTIKRLTPQTTETLGVGGDATTNDTIQAWSLNGTYLMITQAGGNIGLYHGTEPYAFIRTFAQPSVIQYDAVTTVEQPYTSWSNTNDCYFFTTYQAQVRMVNVCTSDTRTTIFAPTTLTDTASNSITMSNGCGGGQCFIYPYVYCDIDTSDRFSFKLVDSNEAVYGFGVIQTNISMASASLVWFHKITSPGDMVVRLAPSKKLPGGSCIGPTNSVYVGWSNWNTWDNFRPVHYGGTIAIDAIAKTITITGISGPWNSVISGDFVLLGGFVNSGNNNFFTVSSIASNVATVSDPMSLLVTETVTNSGNYRVVYDKTHWGQEEFNSTTGAFIRRNSIDDASSHNDSVFLADGSEAYYGPIFVTVSEDFNRLTAIKASDGTTKDTYFTVDFKTNNGSWHASGRGSYGAGGLPGWAIVSTYDGQTVDTAPPIRLGNTEIWAAKLDSSNENRRIAHAQSIWASDYFAQPRPVANRNMTKIIWTSNWRINAGVDDVYLVELPANLGNVVGVRGGAMIMGGQSVHQ